MISVVKIIIISINIPHSVVFSLEPDLKTSPSQNLLNEEPEYEARIGPS